MVVKTKEPQKVKAEETAKQAEAVDVDLLEKMILEEDLLVEEITVDCICGVY